MTTPDVQTPIPVTVIKGPEEESGLAVEFGSTTTFSVPNATAGTPVQLLQRRPTRYKAVIYIPAFANGATSVVLASRLDLLAQPANPQGFTIGAVPFIMQWESQQPLYAVAVGGGPVNISVIDQAQAAMGAIAEEEVQAEDFPDETYQMEGGRYSGNYAGNQY